MADGFAKRDLIAACIAQIANGACHHGRRRRSVERAVGDTGNIAAHRHAVAFRRFDDRGETLQGFRDGRIHIGLRKTFRRGSKDRHFVGFRRLGRLITLQIGGEHGVGNAGPAGNPRHDLSIVGHLRHPFGGDKRRHLDLAETAIRQQIDQTDLVFRRDQPLLVLQPVTGSDLENGDFLRH